MTFALPLHAPALALSIIASDPAVPPLSEGMGFDGLTFEHASSTPAACNAKMLGGVAAADFNGDGWLDLFVHGGTDQNAALFINDGAGGFVDRSTVWGVDLWSSEGGAAAVGDVNGDGRPDIYAGTICAPNALLINLGDGFIDMAEAAGVALPGATTEAGCFGAAFGDIDGDGDLDLYTASWDFAPDYGTRLFLNDGTGVFADVTAARNVLAGPPFSFWPFSPTFADMDGDGAPELLVAADFETSRYYVNSGDGFFFDLGGSNGTCTDENGMGSALGDYDNDGDLDWFVTSIFDDDGEVEGNWGVTGNRLYRNDGRHQYVDVTDAADVRDGGWGWGAQFGDLNHDGWLDLVMTNGLTFANGPSGDPWNPDPSFINDPSRLWLHTGDPDGPGVYVERSLASGLHHTGEGKGLILLDPDHDGDLDLLIIDNLGKLNHWRNDFDPGPDEWIQIDLTPPPGNAPGGVGAVIRLTIGETTRMRTVLARMTYLSQPPLRAHFGFPPAAAIDRISVEWPDGAIDAWYDVAPGEIVTLQRGDVTLDGAVDAADLASLLAAWGPCSACSADLDQDGAVGAADLAILLSLWSSGG